MDLLSSPKYSRHIVELSDDSDSSESPKGNRFSDTIIPSTGQDVDPIYHDSDNRYHDTEGIYHDKQLYNDNDKESACHGQEPNFGDAFDSAPMMDNTPSNRSNRRRPLALITNTANHRNFNSILKFWESMGNNESGNNTLKHKSSLQSLRSSKKSKLLPRIHNSTPKEPLNISAPIPDDISREKLRTKLRNSSPLISLSAKYPEPSHQPHVIDQLLELCDIHVVMTSKDKPMLGLYNQETDQYTPISPRLWRITTEKLGSFIHKRCEIPVTDNFTGSKSKSTQLLQQVTALRFCTSLQGFPKLLQSYVIKENSSFYLVLIMQDHGTPLEIDEKLSWESRFLILTKVVDILANAEQKCKFEHRNLITENIIVNSSVSSVVLSGISHSRMDIGNRTSCSPLTHLHFKNTSERETHNSVAQQLQGNWSDYKPYTNILWILSLINTLLNTSAPPKDKHKEKLQIMARRLASKRLFNRIKSCTELQRSLTKQAP
ncbi:protein kinase ALK2 RNJ42_00234 [Nakaseomyces bracarensis]|uniref:protein kinase ALK2 n=1 Tax=Nakaseomyces bracarensis TaxID=273131 RepID=UPI003872206E